jgi:hypothetical protein
MRVSITKRRFGRAARPITIGLAVGISLALMAGLAQANVLVKIVSLDPYTNTDAFHRTEVETDTYASGNTIVSVFITGRFSDGGGDNIGYATSTDAGRNWTKGFLPSLTIYSNPQGPYKRATDPAIAYDAKHGVWMALALDSLASFGFNGDAVTVNRSTDGGLTFGAPVTVTSTGISLDSTWVSCDNTPTSPFYGNCYVEFDDFGAGAVLKMMRSTDGGLTWSNSTVPNSTVIGGKPVSLPNGTVVVPIDSNPISSVMSFVSTNGGVSYTGPFTISNLTWHSVNGNMRSLPIPSAEVDASGKVYVGWHDCRFRSGCSSNDIVMSTSTNGSTWTAVTRIPIDPANSGMDHFIPGLGVDPAATGHLGLVYYFYPVANCTETTCQPTVGFVSSTDGGATWSAAMQLSGPFNNKGLPLTTSGYMFGDYNSVSYIAGLAHTVYIIEKGSSCTLGQNTSCKVTAASPRQGLPITGGPNRAEAGPVLSLRGDGSSTALQSSR